MADVLVLEDDEATASALSGGLRQHGHQVSVHHLASTALSAVAARTFDLVLLDLGLPDLDGVEVCRRIRAVLPGTVIVLLTARTDEMDLVLGLDAGADDYLTKPFRLADLSARVRAHLRRTGPARTGPAVVELGDLVATQRLTAPRHRPLALAVAAGAGLGADALLVKEVTAQVAAGHLVTWPALALAESRAGSASGSRPLSAGPADTLAADAARPRELAVTGSAR